MRSASRIPDLGFRIGIAIMGIGAAAALSAQEPTRTPTPVHRLSGGFGRPRTTPAGGAPHDGGQSFSDVVHAAHESRDGAPSDNGTLTINNRSLVKSSTKGKVSSSKPDTTAKPAPRTPVPTRAASPAGSGAEAAEPTAPGGDEAQWKQTAAMARKRVVDAKARVAELEASTRKLENDFYAWDDGQYRDRVIKPAWDRAKSDLVDATNEVAEAEKDLAELPEKARRAGAMPGWIRE